MHSCPRLTGRSVKDIRSSRCIRVLCAVLRMKMIRFFQTSASDYHNVDLVFTEMITAVRTGLIRIILWDAFTYQGFSVQITWGCHSRLHTVVHQDDDETCNCACEDRTRFCGLWMICPKWKRRPRAVGNSAQSNGGGYTIYKSVIDLSVICIAWY